MDFGRSNPNPNQLPTPPETDTDFLAGSHHAIDPTNAPGVADSDVNSHPSASAPFRRVSTLAYHNSPFRLGEPRERTTTRQSRWLIVVIPPTWLVQEHGPIGHTLASGPPQRLAQGVLMPLLPTMYGQLTAIAREFNFPSSVGLCIYFHIVEQGFTMTPRVSDETWPTLWGHLFEARSPSTQQSPVCGRIEFDIERRKARWLDSWLTSTRRHAVDVPVSVPSSLSHWRGESKTSFDEKADEHSEALPGAHTRGWNRHIPKKLSLVDKFDTLSVTSSVANAITGNGVANELANSLTTIFQEDEPKTVKKALEQRVQSWRASSSVAPTPIATTGQIGCDTLHIPNKAQVGDVEVLTEVEDVEPLDLNDFAWSVSSIGPQDHDPLASAFSSPRVSSVHLDRRIEGSVLLTPSTATSWGPKSLDYSPVSTLFRLPSPDIGRRMTEDCPPTPSTVTSWGPEELLYSPASLASRLPSPDLGRRMLEDCPPTPSTATSWGPDELLFSPASMVVRLPSPDLGLRALDDPPSPLSARITWGPPAEGDDFSRTSSILTGNHVFPYFMASDRPAWTLIWPFYEKNAASYAHSTCMTSVENNGFNSTPGVLTGNCVFPYFIASDCPAWTLIWPFYEKNAASYAHSTCMTSVENNGLNSTPGVLTGNHVFPYFTASDRPAWTLIWPFYEKNAAFCDSACITPVENNGFNSTPGVLTGNYVFPYFTASDRPAWTLTWPFYGTETVSSAFSSRLPKLYPTIDICRYSKYFRVIIVKRAADDVVYPHFELFPGHICTAQEATAGLSPRNSTEHTGDSSLDMYNGRLNVVRPPVKVSSVYLENGYPTLSIYPPVYPYLCIYPSRHADSVVAQDVEPRLSQNPFSHLELGTQYPSFNLYPASYPNNLMCIYPPAMPGPASFLPFSDADQPPYSSAASSHAKPISSCNKVDQTVDEDPIVYPCFEIYPGHISTGENDGVDRFGVSSPPPSVLYPHFDLYPGPSEDQLTVSSTKPSSQYPSLNLYLPVSPHSQTLPSAVPELEGPKHKPRFHFSGRQEKLTRTYTMRSRLQTGTYARGRVRSGTVSAHPGLRQSISSPSSLPPVPPLPVSTLATRRTTTSNAEARWSGLPVSPVATRNLADRPVSSYTAPLQQPSPIDDEGLLVQSNTLMSANSSQRRDHAHHKQNRPRDSLVLEKARLFEHLNALSNDEPPSSTSSTPGKFARLSSSPVL
ncbi:hypothetical protein EDB84DRAFT_1556303 [Lactarius hengduanensis]|nr:hypothetical protein EDB84DRAFT_1556303 [Lactarius hengduanensis]